MKAFKMADGAVSIFRIDKHYERFVRSLTRMCMDVPGPDIFIEGLKELISKDRSWVPNESGASLYIRPFIYASEERFGVKISGEYEFIIFTGPVPELYTTPIKVRVEQTYNRASRGGTGFAKCGGNYGASYLPTKMAREAGYEQVLWTDSVENRFIEESGMMNIMFVIDGVLVTPPLSDSILDGVTRDSLLQLAKLLGITAEERKISIVDLERAFRDKTITEAFGAGTAAVVAPISTINIAGNDHCLPAYSKTSVSATLKSKLNNIRTGRDEDIFKWNTII
jgi:branched-chain amino acid aminotransferase